MANGTAVSGIGTPRSRAISTRFSVLRKPSTAMYSSVPAKRDRPSLEGASPLMAPVTRSD